MRTRIVEKQLKYLRYIAVQSCSQRPKEQPLIFKDVHQCWSTVCGNKMPTRCNRGFYCRSYCLLNMFRETLCPSSGAQEYYKVVAACGISCCGFQVTGLVWNTQFYFHILTTMHSQNHIKFEVRYLGFKVFFVKQVVRLLVNEQYDGAWNTRNKNKSKIIF